MVSLYMMRDTSSLTEASDQRGKEATKSPTRPVAIAIVDDQGEFVSFAPMDQCAPQPRVIARKKAYTAARTRTIRRRMLTA
jgi:uncharacterized protein GlcG (DUF336 family)